MKEMKMMEIHWGEPFALIAPHDGKSARFGTIEKAHYWLRSKWPIADAYHKRALAKIEAAMECMGSVDDARHAFLTAARSAGYVLTPVN